MNNGQSIKPIETFYKGYRFRSRLEARWAVFFDAIGAEWQYEPQGFEMPDGTKYLPDFYIPHFRGRGRGYCGEDGIWVEIKGVLTDGDLKKIEAFCGWNNDCTENQNRIIIFGQIPEVKWNPPGYWHYWPNGQEYHDGYYSFDFSKDKNDLFYNLEFSEGDNYWTFPKAEKGGGLVLDYPDDPYDYVDNTKTAQAYLKAKQARFEHGEKPIF